MVALNSESNLSVKKSYPAFPFALYVVSKQQSFTSAKVVFQALKLESEPYFCCFIP